ncbi:hypothetical protein N7493_007223 [Penicillium malachiteum]|uniref:Uncharacterized protein n=1 Tax=Penicillium malachiteum TaxID=1324776 RepID=A0AAD6HJ16_9EURO|nr:hypothetical protein N7493_007223 [Penicillium malachiteum]
MDGDQRIKQHERLMARSGNSTAGGRATDHLDSAMHPRGDPTGMSQVPDRAQMSDDYGYTGSSFHSGSLHPNEVGYPTEFTRPRQTPSGPGGGGYQQYQTTPQQQHPQHPQQNISQSRRRMAQDQPPPPPPPSFSPYDPPMLYGFGGQGPAPGPFDVVQVPQYSTRHPAVEALSSQSFVPQYFAPEEQPTVTGVPALTTYVNPQMPYNQPGPMARPNTTQPFLPTMTGFTPIGTASSSRLDPQPSQHLSDPLRLPASDPASLEEAYHYYQRALRNTFDQTRAGRLVEASRLLLEISEWLVTHARDLGILRDDHLSYPDRLDLWKEFNICWLAVCQKQKDLTQDFITTGHTPAQTSLLLRDRMEVMGKDLIRLCDQLEQHGLVDYQMGIWEEEILCGRLLQILLTSYIYYFSYILTGLVLGQCLDLMESKPELHHMQAVPEPATAAPRP